MKKIGRPRRIPNPNEFGQLLKLDEAAQCMGISYDRLRKAIHQHDIPVMQFGRVQQISRAVVQRILDAGEFSAGRLPAMPREEATVREQPARHYVG